MRELLSPKQVADAIGVSEASLKRWCDRGLLPTQRTAGGHRRLPVQGVLQFLRTTGQRVVRPELLGLPASVSGAKTTDRIEQAFRNALEAGDEEQVRRIGLGRFLGGQSIAEICDELIAPAFHSLGERWAGGELEIFQERRAVEVCLRLLHELGRQLPPPAASSPTALVATLEGDHYALALTGIELVLRECGWNAESLGAHHPVASLVAALRQRRPRLLCLSCSHIGEPAAFLASYRELQEEATRLGIAMAVGGRALLEDVRRQMTYTVYGDAMRHLAGFARALHTPPTPETNVPRDVGHRAARSSP